MVTTLGFVGSVREIPASYEGLELTKQVEDVFTSVIKEGPPEYRKSEDWKYTDIRGLLSVDIVPNSQGDKKDFSLVLSDEELREIESIRVPNAQNLVFVDGLFCQEYSSDMGNVSVDFSLQRSKDGDFFKKVPREGINYFAAVSFLYAPQGISFSQGKEKDPREIRENPIHCIFWNRISTKVPQMLYHQIDIGAGKQAEIWMTYLGGGNSLSFVGIRLESRAKLSYRQIFKETSRSNHINHTVVTQRAESNLQSFQMALGGGLTRSSLHVTQSERGATARIDSLYAIREKEIVDFAVDILHKVPNTTSRQLCKGILLDGSRFVYRSKIEVDRDATDTDADQQNKNLLLGEDARVDARPQLDILHDAVKCAHGSAIGQLDAEQLFYLQSRAISTSLSKKILSQGFVQEVYQTHPFSLEKQIFLKKTLEEYFFKICDVAKEE